MDNIVYDYLETKEGKILDIGCGESPFILDMINGDFKFWAFDLDKNELEKLKASISKIDIEYLNKINFYPTPFNYAVIEGIKFDAIILSQIAHFWTFEECLDISTNLTSHMKKGSLLYFRAHSEKHSWFEQKPEGIFFYNEKLLNSIFPKKWFNWLYYSETEKYPEPNEKEDLEEKAKENIIYKDFNYGYITLLIQLK